MDSPNASNTFLTLPPEVRNRVYRHHFTQAIAAIVPPTTPNKTNQTYTDATALQETIGIFLVSRQIYNETHGLFFADFCVGARFRLLTRNSIYSFTRLPTPWTQGLHQITLKTSDLDRSLVRQTLNPIKVALKNGLSRTGEYDSVSIRHHYWDHSGTINIRLQLEGQDVKLDVGICSDLYPDIGIGRENGMVVHLTGPIAKLDWSLIPSIRYAKEQKGWQVSGAVGTRGLEHSRRRRRRSWFGEDERPETAALVDPREKEMSEVQKLCFEAWQELEEYLSKPEGVEGQRVDKAIVKEL